MVYTANWVIICYLPPITRTRKLHWGSCSSCMYSKQQGCFHHCSISRQKKRGEMMDKADHQPSSCRRILSLSTLIFSKSTGVIILPIETLAQFFKGNLSKNYHTFVSSLIPPKKYGSHFSDPLVLSTLVRGWTHPSEKICSSKWVHLPQGSGWK